MPRGMALRKKLTKFTFCKALNFEQFALLKDSRNFNLLLCAKHSGSKKIKNLSKNWFSYYRVIDFITITKGGNSIT